MCAQFIIKAKATEFAKRYGLKLLDEDVFDERVLPNLLAPVIVNVGNGPELRKMKYSLVPEWSSEPRVKFATHNARIETILAKPTWQRPFIEKRCLVPMSSFIEPIYVRDYAGNMVAFSSGPEVPMTAAGLWSQWVDKKTGEVIESFAVITDDPPEFVKNIGHDRCPIFLNESAFAEWLDPNNKDAKKLMQLLKEKRDIPDFHVSKDRPLKSGWEKRVTSS